MIDTHCHLDFEPLCSRLPEVIAAARAVGVTEFVVPGVHPDGWERIQQIAQQYPGVYPAFGIHPMHCECATNDVLSRLATLAQSGVAVGEIGLDTGYAVNMEQQERAFRKQLRIAISLGLPVLVHCRRAFQRTLEIMKQERADHVGGIMHAFSGSMEMAREFITLGFAISISAVVTRHNAVRPKRLARELPLEHLVLETDAPDLPPQRNPGQPNQPAWMIETVRKVAELRGMTMDEVATACSGNSRERLHLMPAQRFENNGKKQLMRGDEPHI